MSLSTQTEHDKILPTAKAKETENYEKLIAVYNIILRKRIPNCSIARYVGTPINT